MSEASVIERTKMQSIKIIGPPYERGKQHGEKLAGLIREKSLNMLTPGSGERARADRNLGYFEKHFEKKFPSYLEEIKGIADGSEIPYQDILRLNFYYILRPDLTPPTQCTYIGFQATPQGPIVAKNEDASPGELLTIFHAIPDNGAETIFATYAGVICNSCGNGMNSHGLAMAGASIGPVAYEFYWDGMPAYHLLKIALERCSTVREFSELLEKTKITGAVNIVVCDVKNGKMLGFEIASNVIGRVKPEAGAVFRSNLALTKEVAPLMKPKQEDLPGLENSKGRMRTLEKLTRTLPRSQDGMKAILRSHDDNTRICQHEGVNGAVMNTDASFIMLPKEKKFLALLGFACEGEYEEYIIGKG